MSNLSLPRRSSGGIVIRQYVPRVRLVPESRDVQAPVSSSASSTHYTEWAESDHLKVSNLGKRR